MADRTAIEWSDATWTPIRARNKATGKVGWHCEHASPGCLHCYSEIFNAQRLGTGLPFKPGHRDDVEHFLDEIMLTQPLRWRRPRMVFVCSMTDLFGDWVPDEWIDRVFAVMALAPQHTFQVLTKRAARMRDYLGDQDLIDRIGSALGCMLDGDWIWNEGARFRDRIEHLISVFYGESMDPGGNVIRFPDPMPLPNVLCGVSAEDQRRADERIPLLLDTLAAVRWVSAEPLLGPIDFTMIPTGGRIGDLQLCGDALRGPPDLERGERLDWVVVGGESGPGARPMHPDWARAIRDECAAAGVPFHFKQFGAWAPAEEPASETQEDEELRGVGVVLDGQYMRRVGKKAAGRLLDGVQHDGFPARPNHPAPEAQYQENEHVAG